MEVEKEEALANLKASGEDTSQLKQISSLFEPSVSFLCQACNSALYDSEKKYPRNFNWRKNKSEKDIKGTVRLIKPYWQQLFVWIKFWKWIL